MAAKIPRLFLTADYKPIGLLVCALYPNLTFERCALHPKRCAEYPNTL